MTWMGKNRPNPPLIQSVTEDSNRIVVVLPFQEGVSTAGILSEAVSLRAGAPRGLYRVMQVEKKTCEKCGCALVRCVLMVWNDFLDLQDCETRN